MDRKRTNPSHDLYYLHPAIVTPAVCHTTSVALHANPVAKEEVITIPMKNVQITRAMDIRSMIV